MSGLGQFGWGAMLIVKKIKKNTRRGVAGASLRVLIADFGVRAGVCRCLCGGFELV